MLLRMIIYTLLLLVIPFFAFAQQGDKNSDRRFNFLEQIYLENDRNQYNEFLIQNFNEFLLLHPDEEVGSDILWMLGSLYKIENKPYNSLLAFLKILYFHPTQAMADSARSQISLLIQRTDNPDLLEKSSLIKEKMESQLPFENKAANHFELLSFLFTLQIPGFNKILLKEIDRYRQLYGDRSNKEDVLIFWQGHLNENLKRFWQASVNYSLLLYLYPHSSLKADALLRSGLIEYKKLGLCEQAAQRFIEIINSYPGTDIAGEAQFHLGKMNQTVLKNNEEALNNYQLLIDAFPEHARRAESMLYSGEILEKEGRYAEAAHYYNMFYRYFSTDPLADKILLKLANLYAKYLDNPKQAAAILLTYAGQFPNTPEAPSALYRAAKLYKKTEEKDKAGEICRRLLEKYPNSSYANKAMKMLKGL
ncbi:MAG TPA: tetratricopeptide repeat protein [Calditrichaeota bacterium]|nr:tetratricopeptide repeat protein [Calditrichota bacterium]